MEGADAGGDLGHLIFDLIEEHNHSAHRGGDQRRAEEAEGEEAPNAFVLYNLLHGRGGRLIAQGGDAAQQDGTGNAGADSDDNAVNGGGAAIRTELVGILNVVKALGDLRGHNIGRHGADGLDDQREEDQREVDLGSKGEQQAQRAADHGDHETDGSDASFAEFADQRPEDDDTDAERRLADHVDQHLQSGAAVHGTGQNPVAVVEHGLSGQHGGELPDQGIAHDETPVLVAKAGLDLLFKRNHIFLGILPCGHGVLCDALFCEVVLQQAGRKSKAAENAHHGDPGALRILAHAEGVDHNGHHDGHEEAGNHIDAGVREQGQRVTLLGIAGGQGHHQRVGHVVDGKGEGEEEVVADHDPHHLNGGVGLRDRIEQEGRKDDQRAAQQQIGSRLTVSGAGLVDDTAHDDVRDGVDRLGDRGHPGQEDAGQAQNVRIKLVQVAAAQTDVNDEHERRAGKVTQPRLRLGGVGGLDAGVKDRCVEQAFLFDLCGHFRNPPFPFIVVLFHPLDCFFKAPRIRIGRIGEDAIGPEEGTGNPFPRFLLDLRHGPVSVFLVLPIRQILGIAAVQAPLAGHGREIPAHFIQDRIEAPLDDCLVSLQCLRAAAGLHRAEIEVRVQHHVPVLLPGHEIFPHRRAEGVVDHKKLVLVHVRHDARISVFIEFPQEFHFDRSGPGLLFRAFGRVDVADPDLFPGNVPGQRVGDRLVQRLDSPKAVSVSVAESQLFQKPQAEIHFLRHAGPLAHAADAAVIKAVLAARHHVQVDQDLLAVFLRHIQGEVQILDAAEIGSAVSENVKRDGDTDRVDPLFGEKSEVLFADKALAVLLHPLPVLFFRKHTRQMVFVLRFGSRKKLRSDPLFQYQPTAEIDAFDLHFLPSIPRFSYLQSKSTMLQYRQQPSISQFVLDF